MTTTRTLTQHKAAPVYGFKAVDGAPEGTFEAIVSVFGNVDHAKERMVAGAFDRTLDEWAKSGDPIPVIFSHQWDNLDAHVGAVLDAKELLPGDPLLPVELSTLGGLYVKGRMDIGEDFAGRLWSKMAERRIREFSFAYDIVKARPGADGALDLLDVDLIEVGPTLKGMNPITALIGAKSAAGPFDALDTADGALDVALAELDIDLDAKRLPADATGDSVEAMLGAVRASAEVWAALEYGRELYALHLEATYPSESRAVVTAERWDDPYGEGPLWELNYSTNADGLVTIDSATELAVDFIVRPKGRERLDAAILSGRKLRGSKATADVIAWGWSDGEGAVSDEAVGIIGNIDELVDQAIAATDPIVVAGILTALDVNVDALMAELGIPDPDEDDDAGESMGTGMMATGLGDRLRASARARGAGTTIPPETTSGGKSDDDRHAGKSDDDRKTVPMSPTMSVDLDLIELALTSAGRNPE